MKKYRGWGKAGWLMAVTLPLALTNVFAEDAAKPGMGKVEQSIRRATRRLSGRRTCIRT